MISINKKHALTARILLVIFLAGLPLAFTSCRVPFAVSLMQDVPCTSGTYVKEGYSGSVIDRAKKVTSEEFLEIKPDGTFFLREHDSGPVFMEVDGKYQLNGDKLTLVPADDLHLPKQTGVIDFANNTIRDSENVVWHRRADCDPRPTDWERAKLITEIERLRFLVLDHYDTNMGIMARDYGRTSYYRNSIRVKIAQYGGLVLHAWKGATDIVGSVLGGEAVRKQFFSKESTVRNAADAAKYAQAFGDEQLMRTKDADAAVQLAQAGLFVGGLSGFWEEYGQYETCIPALDSHSKQADEFYREDFGVRDAVERDMREYLGEASGVILMSYNKPKYNGHAMSSNSASTYNEGRQRIEDRFNALIDGLPDELPAGFSTDKMIAEIQAVKSGLGGFKSHPIDYNAILEDGTLEPRKAFVGTMYEYEDLQLFLVTNYEDRGTVRVWQTINDGAGIGLFAVSSYLGGSGRASGQLVTDIIGLGNDAAGEGVKAFLVKEQEVKPLSAMNSNSFLMALELGQQQSELWTLTDGFCNYINHTANG